MPIFNLRGTAAFRRQGDRSGLTRAQHPSEAQSNKLCDPSMGEQNLLSKAASFRGQWFTVIQFHDGLACPTILCNWCGEAITEARLGGYFYPVTDGEEGTTAPLTYLHKGMCDQVYTGLHPELQRWGELREFPTFLARNLNLEGTKVWP